jgi:hypothetical protein
VYDTGDVQGVNESTPVDSEHWKLDPGSELNANVGALLFVGLAGAVSIVTTGEVVSIVSALLVVLVLPAASLARTANV